MSSETLASLLSNADTKTNGFAGLIHSIKSRFSHDPETMRRSAFLVSVVALSAKLAKADGVVTADEVVTFNRVFQIDARNAKQVTRIYNMARREMAGFASYAQQVKFVFPDNSALLEDLVEGLFQIAAADGSIHPNELKMMDIVADIFGLNQKTYAIMKQRFVQPEEPDPYEVLDADASWDIEALKMHYRKVVRQYHPDAMTARGLPPEMIAIATTKLASINKAWDAICEERAIR